MKWVQMAGASIVAVVGAYSAQAEAPKNATVWIGLVDSFDGFLVDETTGDVWMTGQCLKALPQAVQDGQIWVSEFREMASVGRLSTLVDQTFHLDTAEATPSIAIDNPSRGGLQVLPGVERVDCANGACAGLTATPACAS